MTIQGIASGNSDLARIVASGVTFTSTTDDFGTTIYAQVWVDNVTSGNVNLTNLTVDGTGNSVACPAAVVGIYYQISSGTVNRDTAENQSTYNATGCGYGIEIQGGAANPTVTVQNSSVHDFDSTGIQTATNANTPEVNATIKSTFVHINNPNERGIVLNTGTANTVTGNTVEGASPAAIESLGSSSFGTVTSNHVTSGTIAAHGDNVSFSSNNIYNSDVAINLLSALAPVKANNIYNAGVGIEFNCVANNNVNSNTINDTATALDQVPSGVTSNNVYYNVATIRTSC
ncbi:MAG: hypothetical protein JOY93_06780 [Acidobacteriales bacterium]|nr:hypothetical protein [Terriglobales bacterium]